MNRELLAQLKQITPEEEQLLAGNREIQKQLYMSDENNVIDAGKLLEEGKMLQVRTHTRFVHFPRHTHNYIEMIYMCSGSTRHLVNGEEVVLSPGELLILNQSATQEIFPAGKEDIAVNFIILPQFFESVLGMLEPEENLLRDFLVDCLKGTNDSSGYLHFKVAEILPIQNLLENLIWTLVHKQPNKRRINQTTMGLLFLQLMNHLDRLETDTGSDRQRLLLNVLGYIEEHYRDGELTELAERLHYDVYWLSKEIKKRTGRNYTELVQTRRLNQAAFLLSTTSLSVLEIALAVGYDNISYFHRLFRRKYQMSPRSYRLEQREGEGAGGKK